MNFVSTRNRQIKVNSCEAVYQGLAQDGGLFVPERIPAIDFDLKELDKMSYREIAKRILNLMLPDFGAGVIDDCVEKGYCNKFDTAECVDIKHVGAFSFLELYHGPTSAFKDMALCILPRLVTASSAILGQKKKTIILTATSGDTGKAALEGFANVPGTGIIVFYPEHGVSDIQKAQMKTQEGSNVFVCGVEGNFDDVQTGVKKAFRNLNEEGITFSSANSINIGRLVPQIAYYFYSYGRMVRDGKISFGEKLNFSVPTGNFGDILAGWFAKKMGLPVGRLLCASNKNNILSDFIRTGKYDCRRDFYTTASPSMDILISSNLERLLFYASGCDDAYVKSLMDSLASSKYFEVSKDVLSEIQKDFDCGWADEKLCFNEIKSQWNENHYLMDTHTSVASVCAKQMSYKDPCVVLSTASPYKFSSSILSALECTSSDMKSGFEMMEKLNEVSKVSVPENLKKLAGKELRFSDVIKPEEIQSKVESVVRGVLNEC